MPAGPQLLMLTLGAVALLLVLILWARLHAFLALLLTSMALGLACGMAPAKLLKSIQSGFGEALGFIAVVVALGAMIGRFIEHSGGGRALAERLLSRVWRKARGVGGAVRLVSHRAAAVLRGRLRDSRAAGDQPGAYYRQVAAVLRTPHRLRADRDSCHGAAASWAGRRSAIASRRPGPRHSLRHRRCDPNDPGRPRLFHLDLAPPFHTHP